MEAEPDELRISTPSFSQTRCGQTHRGDHAESFKSNLARLRCDMDATESRTKPYVHYHVYRSNAAEELDSMAALCSELGIELGVMWAQLISLESTLELCERPRRDLQGGRPLAVDEDFVLSTREMQAIAGPHWARPCMLQPSRRPINFDDSVALCCMIYHPKFALRGHVSPVLVGGERA